MTTICIVSLLANIALGVAFWRRPRAAGRDQGNETPGPAGMEAECRAIMESIQENVARATGKPCKGLGPLPP